MRHYVPGELVRMKNSYLVTFLAVASGIAASLLLYIFVSESPYFLGVGCIIGFYLAKPSTMKLGTFYGAVMAIPMGIYIVFITNRWGSGNNLLLGLWNVVLFAGMGGFLGMLFVWTERNLKRDGISFY